LVDFHISIMFVGILLMSISFVWIAFDKKKQLDDKEVLQEKKEMLVSVISDAELMIEELNNISDYLVSNIDKKRQEVVDTIKEADEKNKTVTDKRIKEIIDKEIKTIMTKKAKEITDKKATEITNKEIKTIINKEIKTITTEKIREIVDKEIKAVIDKKIKTAIDKEIKIIEKERISNKVDKTYFTESKEPLIDDENVIFRNVLSEDSLNKSFSNKINSQKKIISINNRYKEVISLSQSGLNKTQIAKKLNMGKGEIQLVLGINK
jgi:bacterioferritin-associated ferredoxin